MALKKIPNVETLNRLAKQGLTEKDIVRRGRDVFLKPGSPFEKSLEFPTREIRDLGLQEGRKEAFINLNRGLAENISRTTNQTNFKDFGMKILNLLLQSQKLGTRPFVEQEFGAQEEQLKRIEQTPANLIGAEPRLQESVRIAQAQAIQPTITGARQAQQTFTEQIRALGNTIEQARRIGEWIQNIELQQRRINEDQRQEAQKLIVSLPEAVKNLPEDQKRALEKRAGMPRGIIDVIPTEERKNIQFLSTRSQTQKPASLQEEPLQFDFTPEDRRILAGFQQLGVNFRDKNLQNIFVNVLTASERDEFLRDLQKARQIQSVDVDLFFRAWLGEKTLREKDSEEQKIPSLKDKNPFRKGIIL